MALKLGHQGQVVCPICNEEYVHVVSVTKIDGADGYKALDGYVRGDVDVVTFECESGGHRFDLQLGFHKGQTMARVLPVKGT